jgi:hypothetical protein
MGLARYTDIEDRRQLNEFGEATRRMGMMNRRRKLMHGQIKMDSLPQVSASLDS